MMWIVAVVLVTVIYLLWRSYKNRLRVDGLHKKCVFITGCDSGFGNMLAVRLDGLGVPVFAGCLTEDGAQQLKEKCSQRLHTVKLDVTSPESVKLAYEYVTSHLPQGTMLWGVVNNAGIIHCLGPVEFLSRQDYLNMMSVNFLGIVEVTTTFLPALKKTKGRIVNMASMSALMPAVDYAAYAASKYAVKGYTDILRLEKAVWGVSVSCVFPGLFLTNLWKEFDREKKDARWSTLPADIREDYGEDYNDRASQYHQDFAKLTEDPSLVVDAYEHALFSPTPQPHYYPGYLTKYIVFVTSYLPRRWFEAIFMASSSPPRPKVLQ